ncbi:hypothetical protein N801_09705 [Knoellia aerolata DSM 18566]|uniref:Uncharacterized protein n=1 Tax=Knoellia aerolata DSM 18566 TaxID=1385519 RepID=A0A0A0JUL6_9MICO|nr:hypothetical protein N801_09705 [Knoellia aerolata DSM 18566]
MIGSEVVKDLLVALLSVVEEFGGVPSASEDIAMLVFE